MGTKFTIELTEVSEASPERLVIAPYDQEDVEAHDHHFFELVYITGGSTWHTRNGQSSMVREGDYFIIDYGSIHSYQRSSGLTLLNCLFLPEIIDETMTGCLTLDTLMQGCLIRYYSPTLVHSSANRIFHDDDGRVLGLMRGMLEEYHRKEAGYAEIFRCRLIEILLIMLRSLLPREMKRPKNETIRLVIDYVDRSYHEAVTLGTFCGEYHFNLQYISRLFKQETGMTFRDYLQKVRIEKSCELLGASTMSITEIAQQVGYGDAKFFTRIFKRKMKTSPREYRRIITNY